MSEIVYYFGQFILAYFIFVWVGYTISLALTIPIILARFSETKYNDIIASIDKHAFLPITTIIPAFNEMHRIDDTIASVQKANYKHVHMIIVNDGSTDGTLKYLIDKYQLKPISPAFRQTITTGTVRGYYQSQIIPNFIVVDKEHSPFCNSGADCINAGLNACRTPLFLTLDADTIIEPESLSRMLFMFLTQPHCIVIGGHIYVPDRKKVKDGILRETSIPSNITLASQVVEYLRSFIYGHEGWTKLGGALCHAGAFTLLEKKAVMDIGGYDAYNFSYDAEIIMKLHHYMLQNGYPYTIAYASNAIAWADSPFTLKGLWKQRNYWQRGLLRCLVRHKAMFLNPRYKIVGLIGFPIFVFYEIIGPVIEGCAYIMLLIAFVFQLVAFNTLFWMILWCYTYLLVITVACMMVSVITYNKYHRKTDVLRLVYITIIELIFYRPFRGICCAWGLVHYIYNRIRKKPL